VAVRSRWDHSMQKRAIYAPLDSNTMIYHAANTACFSGTLAVLLDGCFSLQSSGRFYRVPYCRYGDADDDDDDVGAIAAADVPPSVLVRRYLGLDGEMTDRSGIL
jgi:hypothetical protein